jgi:hypothetical protein
VSRMRVVQRRFFGGDRGREVVAEAKVLERRVDALTAELLLLEDDKQTRIPGT